MKTVKRPLHLPFFLAVIVGCLAAFPKPAHAELLFSTNNQVSAGTNQLINTTDRLGSDFTTGPNLTIAQSTTLTMFNNNNDNSFTAHNFTASIFTDNAGVPGILVGSFSSF